MLNVIIEPQGLRSANELKKILEDRQAVVDFARDKAETPDKYNLDYENVTFTANYWLPGVDTLSLKNDGSVRVYGTWSGVHSATGNEFSLGSYHTMAFDADGKISVGGDWFDLTGFIQQSQKVSEEEVME